MHNYSQLDSSKANPNLDAIREHFQKNLSRYFYLDGSPREEFFEPTVCYNCGKEKIQSEFTIARFRHVRCYQCGMVYVSPRLKADTLHDSYGEDAYTEHYRLKLIPSLGYRLAVIDQRKFAQVSSYFNKPGSVLDIGCGLGDLLSVFHEQGWDCLGIEFNQFAAEFASTEFGLNVETRSIFEFDPAGYQFECVMLWGALEHFTQPQVVLEKAYTILKPDGLLVLEVPSGDSLLVKYCELHGGDTVDRIIEGDRHIMLFSERALSEMTERAGFSRVHLQSNGLDMDTLLRLEGEKLPPEFVARLQETLDISMYGDLLRGFWRK